MKMRKTRLGCFLACSVLLWGCAETPESSLVKQKGTASMKNYEEGETLAALETDTDKTQRTLEESESGQKEQADYRLRNALGAPEHYESQVTDETGKLTIFTDADVEIPGAGQVSAISVSQHPFDQEVMDRVTNAFFPDAKIYDGVSYNQMTKEDLQRRIEILKGYVAEGNLDPYQWGTDEEGNLQYDIYAAIEAAQNAWQNAPEKRTLKEVHPQFNLEVDNGEGGTESMGDYFSGVACTEDGKVYSYIMSGFSSMPMQVHIQREYDEIDTNVGLNWVTYEGLKGNDVEVPSEEELKLEIGIRFEEAKALTDEKVALLEIPDMEMNGWEYCVAYSDENGYRREGQKNCGYKFYYSRTINGIPITCTLEWGGSLEEMDSEMETWSYEILEITVSKDGIEEVDFCNMYDIGDVKTENLNLLPFDEIMEIYEKMMVIQNADLLNYESMRNYRIHRITFGYSRIYEPSSSAYTGLMVPVWDFFGEFDGITNYNGEELKFQRNMKYQSFLTINAVDGSVIDRGLGY